VKTGGVNRHPDFSMIETKKAAILTFLLVLLNLASPGINEGRDENFKLIGMIGDDRDDYAFTRISGAALSPCKEIFISDVKGHFIAKYDWEGNFIKRVGRTGAGPGDFKSPQQIGIINESLFVLDFQNARISEMDLNLENIQYFRLNGKIAFMQSFTPLEKNKFLVTPFWPSTSGINNDEKFRIFVIDRDSKILRAFFKETPIPPADFGIKDQKTLTRLDMLSRPVFGLDDKREKLLVSFVTPDNPIVFYLYNLNGETIKKFHFELESKYRFPTEVYRRKQWSLSMLDGLHAFTVRSIFFYGRYWYIFIEKTYYKKHDDVNREYIYVKYDEMGKFIGKYEFPAGFECYDVSAGGYILGKQPYAEIERLMIYKIN